VAAPAVVALFDAAVWLPWVLVALCASAGAAGMWSLGARLPASAVNPASVPAR
jgi:hypothetical protein